VTPRKILFVTGTRADFSKLKQLMLAVQEAEDFESQVFVTGMHLMPRYGYTVNEVTGSGLTNLTMYENQEEGDAMDIAMANTILGLAAHVEADPPDLLVLHGDRIEAHAGTIVGALRNIRVAHIEGGELSGSIDDSLRHAASKLAHIHFVSNTDASQRLQQMGESPDSIWVVGSPEVDLMVSSESASTFEEAKERYDLPFDDYGIVVFHPVTTEHEETGAQANALVEALLDDHGHFVVLSPNNDAGTAEIIDAYRRLDGNPRFRKYPSIRFELYLALLRHAQMLVGNSSSGVREAPVFGVPSVNIGTRQSRRATAPSIINVEPDAGSIAAGIVAARTAGHSEPLMAFGKGDSVERIMAALRSDRLWSVPISKQFLDD
jgi:UDP-N-acetylglucosamine 2-epimerase (hydrolysing)